MAGGRDERPAAADELVANAASRCSISRSFFFLVCRHRPQRALTCAAGQRFAFSFPTHGVRRSDGCCSVTKPVNSRVAWIRRSGQKTPNIVERIVKNCAARKLWSDDGFENAFELRLTDELSSWRRIERWSSRLPPPLNDIRDRDGMIG